MNLFEWMGASLLQLGQGECAPLREALTKAELRDLQELNDVKELQQISLDYSWTEVANSTDCFSETRKLGSGASGTVYRGSLQEGTEVAVKVIETPVNGSFEVEVRLLSRCRHPNVVMLLGFSKEPPDGYMTVAMSARAQPQSARKRHGRQRSALVYELLHGGDLYVRLQSTSQPFTWWERLRAAADVSRGLAHLHKHRPEIFHRDIKSQNILFSSDGTAKIADFGLACVSARLQASIQGVAGTLGYVDPQYVATGVITEASEVYSLGMVFIELLTGRPPAVVAPDGRSCIFLNDELKPHEDGAKRRLLQRIDARAPWPMTTASSLATLALLCIHNDADRRPSFIEVTTILQGLANAAVDEISGGAAPVLINSMRGARVASLDELLGFNMRQVHASPAGSPVAAVGAKGTQKVAAVLVAQGQHAATPNDPLVAKKLSVVAGAPGVQRSKSVPAHLWVGCHRSPRLSHRCLPNH